MWNKSLSVETGLMTVMTANTMEAAPRSPEKLTSSRRPMLPPNGAISKNTAAGRAAKVKNSAMATAGPSTAGIWEGKDSSPSRKNSTICIMLVTPSKNGTSVALLRMSPLPSRMPVMYTLKKPLPPSAAGAA